jgi:hypothetical protein
MRARKLIELGLLDDLLKELLAIGEELGIKDELLTAFQEALRQQEGVKVGTDELQKPEGTEKQTTNTKERIAILADTWLKSYRQVITTGVFSSASPAATACRSRTSTVSCTASRRLPPSRQKTRRSPGKARK